MKILGKSFLSVNLVSSCQWWSIFGGGSGRRGPLLYFGFLVARLLSPRSLITQFELTLPVQGEPWPGATHCYNSSNTMKSNATTHAVTHAHTHQRVNQFMMKRLWGWASNTSRDLSSSLHLNTVETGEEEETSDTGKDEKRLWKRHHGETSKKKLGVLIISLCNITLFAESDPDYWSVVAAFRTQGDLHLSNARVPLRSTCFRAEPELDWFINLTSTLTIGTSHQSSFSQHEMFFVSHFD